MDGYGKYQGENVAGGFLVGATGAASLAGHPFNVLGVSFVSQGLFAVTLVDGVDPLDSASFATAVNAGQQATSNEGGADTDTVKRYALTSAAGTLVNGGLYFKVMRNNVP